jgi:hypothetical protein
MRRWKLLATLTAIVLLGIVVVLMSWPRSDRITRENCQRIRSGMSRAEVLAILGPPGDYSTGPLVYAYQGRSIPFRIPTDPNVIPESIVTQWADDSGGILVHFDAGDRVLSADFFPLTREEQGRFENFLWRLRRKCQRWFSW